MLEELVQFHIVLTSLESQLCTATFAIGVVEFINEDKVIYRFDNGIAFDDGVVRHFCLN